MSVGMKVIIGFHMVSFSLWLIGQTGAVLDYDTVAAWGLQGPRDLLDPVIVEVNRGIGLADTFVMLPLHAAALLGLIRGRFYGLVTSWLVFGMTIYWPTVFWCSQYFYSRAGVVHQPTQPEAVILPAVMMAVAIWGSWYLAKNRSEFE
ncbi:MAG: hypothetical protein HKO65_05740 [Gemmatimonadetes bacterium]|nr:hypothetical protein [Gemmatimonadota bacterium]NNM04587.1 hypothetical protein [Gemmatimonadota bacterium]